MAVHDKTKEFITMKKHSTHKKIIDEHMRFIDSLPDDFLQAPFLSLGKFLE